jgi:nucleotide-binding universal stress UspA family protein
MPEPTMFSKILVPIDVDYSSTAAAVYRKTAALARCTGAEVRLTTVMPGFGMPIVAAHITEEAREQARERVQDAMKQFIQDHCDETVSHEIRTGKNWEEIIEAAEEWGADLIVVYHNRRHPINEVFSRSCAQRVTDNAGCSVLRLRKVQG